VAQLNHVQFLGPDFFCSAHVFQNNWSKAYHFGSRRSKSCLAIACVIFEVGRLNRPIPKFNNFRVSYLSRPILKIVFILLCQSP
jgi:hypothetical protein